MAAPGLVNAVAGMTGIGSAIGAYGANDRVQKGMTAFNNLAGAGRNTLEAGKQGSTQAFDPYAQTGSAASGQLGTAGRDYKGEALAGMPQQQLTTAQGTQAWLDPSAAYSMDQASKATQASALAKGGMGGGLAKALSNNANQKAMTNWNNAYNQQLGANAQNFGQANLNWQNKKGVLDTNVGNLQTIANMGLSATNANQVNQLAYNQDINKNYLSNAANSQKGWNDKAGIFDAGVGRTVDNLVPGLTSIFGGK